MEMALWLLRVCHEESVVSRVNQPGMEEAHLNPSVLVVEDETVARRALDKLLTRSGYHTFAVGSGEEALRFLDDHEGPNIALIDLDLPGMNGAELLRRLRELSPDTHAVIMTATSAERVHEIIRDRHIPHLRKPLDFRTLLRVLAQEARPN